MAFNFLSNLISGTLDTPFDSPVDEEEGDIDDESDIEIENEKLDDDLGHTSRPNYATGDGENDDSTSDTDSNVEEEEFPWSSTLQDVQVELFTSRPGPNLSALNINHDSKPIDFFKLFFPESLFTLAADQTNLYATQRHAPASFKSVTRDDISHFLYINMMFGIHKMPAYTMYWSTDPLLRVPAVADVMSRNRYSDISRYFHLADRELYIPRNEPGHNPLHKIQPVIDQVLKACQSSYLPDVALSVDEAMIPFQGRLYFKQYMKGKPNPWGVKVWCCCDSSNGYLTDFSFYTGKAEVHSPNGLGYDVVMSLASRYLYQHRHLYFDNFFASVRLAKDLLDKDTYSCATIRSNRKHWPNELKCKIQKGQFLMRQVGNIVACFWRDKRPVSLISTNVSPRMGSANRRTKDGVVEKEIPLPVLAYNSNMAGVDLCDQLRSYYPVGRKSYKWWRSCFWFLVEVCLINAYIVYKNMPRPDDTTKKLSHLQFHLEVARSLMQGVVKQKRIIRETGPAPGGFNLIHDNHRRIRLPGRKKQCFMCRKKDVRTESGQRPETVFGCLGCETHLCDELCFAQFHEELKN